MRHLACLGVLLQLGCEADLSPPPASNSSGAAGVGDPARAHRIRLEPPADLDRAPRVLRVRVGRRDRDAVATSELRMFRGELSDYHLGRIERGDLPATLLDRQVPTARWIDQSTGELVVAPLTVLQPGEQYSVAGVGCGLLANLRVQPAEHTSLYRRVWPPSGVSCASQYVVYCGSGPPPEPQVIHLEPGHISAVLRPGVDPAGTAADRCLHWTTSGAAPDVPGVLPPPAVGRVALEPLPIASSVCAGAEALACEGDEQRWALGCADIQDDRVVMRPPLAPTLWVIGGEVPSDLVLVGAGGELAVRGLVPSSTVRVEIAMTDLSGQTERFVQLVETQPPQPHLVINEVLANAVGPEPAQEWVEIYNDGTLAVPLAGWVLQDSGGPTELPEHLLGPGEYAVLLSERYVPDAELDVVPAPTAAWLTVPRLGRNGLSNVGELLRLLSPAGAVASRFPAVAATEAGVSVARRDPAARASDPDAFGLHAPPGASPGQPNQLR